MNVNRRDFLLNSAFASAFLAGGGNLFASAIPPRIRKPGEKPVLAMIGMGIQARGLLHQFLGQDIVVKTICDVDAVRRADGVKRVNDYYASRPELKMPANACTGESDFRKVLADPGVDMVCVATPDHWHAYITVEAFKHGKDVYCEKPLTYSIVEAKIVMEAAKKYGRILQTGAMQRSSDNFRTAAMICRNGGIGQIKFVDCNFGGPSRPHRDYENPANAATEGAPNPDVDFDMWCGGAPLVKYSDRLAPRGVHNFFPMFWRFDDLFGSGYCGDWGAHHLDIAQWGLDKDSCGPVKIVRSNEAPSKDPFLGGRRQSGMQFVFKDGCVMQHNPFSDWGTVFYGTEGIVAVNRGKLAVWLGNGLTPDAKVREQIKDGTFDALKPLCFWNPARKPEDNKCKYAAKSCLDATNKAIKHFELKKAKVQLYKSINHPADFVARFLDRKPACSNEQVGARSAILCHLCNMSYVHDTGFDWCPKNNVFANGTGNEKWLAREVYRNNWNVTL